ncbi:uncharacterized protein LOC114527630 [Dendronephthya gigantea]|uniref:uncharacterized protein LOC114527630 n=1 Tax=Dendronephthya gigantea TaxID=151771 RepID=UPI00106A1BB9|nr:uncharacterized protein LOC114527630 [Dendronephthya gigantea]
MAKKSDERETSSIDSPDEGNSKDHTRKSFQIDISEEHGNWLAVGELIRLIRKPIATYVDEIVKAFHQKLCHDLSFVGKCKSPEDCRKKTKPGELCVSCKRWSQDLNKSHRAGSNPSWHKNCNSAKWSEDPWEVAKFFMSALGSNQTTVKDAKSTDLSSLLNVLEWIKDGAFPGKTRVDIELARKLRSQVRNTWAHAPKQEFDHSKKSQSFSIANEFLEDLEAKFSHKETKDCKEYLDNLEKNGVANIVESELKSLLLQRQLLDDIKEEMTQMKVDRSSDKSKMEEHERKLKKLEVALNECSQRMSDFESLKENINRHFNIFEEQLKYFRAIPEDIHEIRNSIGQIRDNLAKMNERQKERGPTRSLLDRVPKFTAREGEIKEVFSLLIEERKTVVSLHGGPGFGKTAIAIEVSHQLSEDPNITVIFSQLTTKTTVDEMVRQLCLDVGVNYEYDDPKQSLVLCLKNVKTKIIFVMDDIDNQLEQNNRSGFDDFIKLLGKIDNCQMITTSRSSYQIPGLSVEKVDVEEMDDKACMELLKKQCSVHEDEFLQKLAEECGKIPLAMCIAAPQVDDFEDPFKFLHYLEKEPFKTLECPETNQYVYRAINMSYDRLDKALKETFVRLAEFDGSFSEKAASFVIEKDIIDTKRIRNDLVRRSLIKQENENRYSIHLLIKHFVRDQLRGENEMAERAREQATRAKLLMVEFYLELGHDLTIKSYSKDGYKPNREALKQEAHNIQNVLKICFQQNDDSSNILNCLAESEIYTCSGKFFSLLVRTIIPGSIVDKFLQSCAQLAQKREDHAIKMNFDCLLAEAERDRTIGIREDEAFTSKMKEIEKKFETHYEVLKHDKSLCAYYYYLFGRYLLRKSERCKGKKSKERSKIQKQAREELEKSLELRNTLIDTPVGMADKVFTLLQLGNVCKLISTTGNFVEQAQEYYKEATKLSRDNFGDHELTSHGYKTHGDLYLKIDEYDKAKVNYTLAKEMREKLGLDANKKHVSLLNNLGICLRKNKQQSKAIEVLESARDMAEKLAESDEPNRCKSKVYTNLALAHNAVQNGSQYAANYAKKAFEFKELKGAIKWYEYDELCELQSHLSSDLHI